MTERLGPLEQAAAIFERACQLQGEARAAYLEGACSQDATLRAEVDSMIEARAVQGDFLAEPTVTAATAIAERPGATIGNFKLLQQIGEGGFGVVYMAEQLRPVSRHVALKIIKPGMDTREVIARFEAERQALAMMDYPNIAQVLDGGTTASGRPYFVMELVKGVPLIDFCDQNKIPTRQRLELFITVCRAIQHAHQKGVIHRDIKPSNVMVTLHDGQPVPKVIDFGVAKAISQKLTEKTLFTSYGQMIGTPQYMSPEQAEMSGLDIDTRSDIYSLGVLLYELLIGTTPLEAKQLRGQAFAEMQRMIRETEPPRPSIRLSTLGKASASVAANRGTDSKKLGTLLRGELDWIVMKALEKDRSRRYETAHGFALDVQRYLNNEAVVACPPTARYRLLKFARRNKTAFATSGIIAVALLVGTILSTWQAFRATHAEGRAAIAASEANNSAEKAAEQRDRALRSEGKLREQLYASDMNVVSQAYADGDIDRMNELLDKHRPITPEAEDQRGFEWYHWWRAGHLHRWSVRSDDTLSTFGAFRHLAVSPNGKTVAVGGIHWVHLYDSATQRLLRSPLVVLGWSMTGLCFSPDGAFLVVTDNGSTRWTGSGTHVFDTRSWRMLSVLESEKINAVAFAQDQPILATASPRHITLWNYSPSTWDRVATLPVASDIKDLAFTPDGTKLVAKMAVSQFATADCRIVIWDVLKRTIIPTPSDPRASAIAISADGNLLASGDTNGNVRIWKLAGFADGSPASILETLPSSAPIESVAFSPEGTRLVVGTGAEKSVVVWDIASQDPQPIAAIQGHSRRVSDVSFVNDANTVWSCSDDGYVKVWGLSSCQPYDTLRGVDLNSQVGYADDGTLIYKDCEGVIQRWDVAAGKSLSPLDSGRKYRCMAVSDQGEVLAGVTFDNELCVWDLVDRRPIQTKPVEPSDYTRLVVSRDGRTVAGIVSSPREIGPVVITDLEYGLSARNAVYANTWPAFSPSGRYLWTQLGWSADHSSQLLDVTVDPIQQRYQVLGTGVGQCAAFSPDEATLAIGSSNHDILLYDADAGELKQTLKGHTRDVRGLAFTRDGSRLVSGGRDRTVRIWKVSDDGRSESGLVSTLRGHADGVEFVAVAPSGNSIASLSADGKIHIWRRATQQEVHKNVDEHLIRANRHVHQKQLDKALHELDNALVQAPNNLRALALRGRVHDQRGNWSAAIADFSTARELADDNQYFLESRAKAYALGRQWTKSADDWSRLVHLTDASNDEYLLARGECYRRMKRHGDARADLTKALSLSTQPERIRRIISFLDFGEPVVPTQGTWHYSTDRPPTDWQSPSFEDAAWQVGMAPLGNAYWGRTPWQDSPDIWLRHTFQLDREIEAPLVFHVLADRDVQIFLNGVLAASAGHAWAYQTVPCLSQARLRLGENGLAVYCHSPGGGSGSGADVGLYVQRDLAEIEATLSAAVKQAQNNSSLLWMLTWRLMRQGRWKEAAAYCDKQVELLPTDTTVWTEAASLCVYSGDEMNRYHHLAGEMLERFGETNDPANAANVAKACLIVQPSKANLPSILAITERALTLDANVGTDTTTWARVAKAMAEYRGGNDQAAIELAQQCISTSVRERDGIATGVLTLAHARLGERELAREEMKKLKELIQENAPHHTGAQFGGSWHDWLICEILLREVEEQVTED